MATESSSIVAVTQGCLLSNMVPLGIVTAESEWTDDEETRLASLLTRLKDKAPVGTTHLFNVTFERREYHGHKFFFGYADAYGNTSVPRNTAGDVLTAAQVRYIVTRHLQAASVELAGCRVKTDHIDGGDEEDDHKWAVIREVDIVEEGSDVIVRLTIQGDRNNDISVYVDELSDDVEDINNGPGAEDAGRVG